MILSFSPEWAWPRGRICGPPARVARRSSGNVFNVDVGSYNYSYNYRTIGAIINGMISP